VLSGSRALDEVLERSSKHNLEILGTGAPPSNPVEILHSHHASKLFDELNSSRDFVVIDSAPVLSVADSLFLGAMVDGVVLVVRANGTRRDAVARSREQLVQSGAKILGGILEGASARARRRRSISLSGDGRGMVGHPPSSPPRRGDQQHRIQERSPQKARPRSP
jgi:Mrp family chromosome partitioning ATPase